MKNFMVVAVFISTLALFAVAQNKDTKPAQTAAESWLALSDTGDFGATWDEASSSFKGAITKPRWKEMVSGVRPPLGKVVSRTLKSAEYTTTVPGAPDGEYVVIQYATSFENKKSAIETITPMLDKDGQWRVSGYFIR